MQQTAQILYSWLEHGVESCLIAIHESNSAKSFYILPSTIIDDIKLVQMLS